MLLVLDKSVQQYSQHLSKHKTKMNILTIYHTDHFVQWQFPILPWKYIKLNLAQPWPLPGLCYNLQGHLQNAEFNCFNIPFYSLHLWLQPFHTNLNIYNHASSGYVVMLFCIIYVSLTSWFHHISARKCQSRNRKLVFSDRALENHAFINLLHIICGQGKVFRERFFVLDKKYCELVLQF